MPNTSQTQLNQANPHVGYCLAAANANYELSLCDCDGRCMRCDCARFSQSPGRILAAKLLPKSLVTPRFLVPEPPGMRLEHEGDKGLDALHPVVMVPGIVTGGLELWEGRPCSEGPFCRQLWGGSFTEILRRPMCWLEHLSLDDEMTMRRGSIHQALGFMLFQDYFAPGYFVWAILIENLARMGYEGKNMYMAAYDWRLFFQRAMAPGGETIWGNLDWSPEEHHVCDSAKKKFQQDFDNNGNNSDNQRLFQVQEPSKYGRIISFGKIVSDLPSSVLPTLASKLKWRWPNTGPKLAQLCYRSGPNGPVPAKPILYLKLSIQESRMVCDKPWFDRLLDQTGDYFRFVIVGGSTFYMLKGMYNSPKGEPFIQGLQPVRVNAPRCTSNCGIFGGLSSVLESSMIHVRQKDDPWTSILSDAGAAGFLKMR
ncbi:unnamed protein product [Fraxinus pennsylvanica]|uniref:Uncharacterized protein n=1 Tax=Fraxinus pennsylvanica TaxID=56036 RepID=A0AAD2E5V4_9LAMI|nr:unnamed protein product [Fraxinus pennsylvanica]